jgi:GR25 family glycosyltransferase involved in LPS biosynthesis
MEKFDNIIFTEPRFNQQPSAWIEHIPFAFYLIEKLRPKMFVELGTQFGNSYFAFCQAIGQLKLTTKAYGVDIWISFDNNDYAGHKIFNHTNAINANHFSHFSNLLMMTFDEALQYFNAGEIDLLHIDGMHDYASVKHDFENWLPKMSDAGVIIFHDTNVRENNFGVWKLMDEIKDEYPNFQFNFGKGLGVVCTGQKVPEEFLRFAKDAQTDEFTHQLFNALGSRWRLKNQLETVENRTADTIRQLTDRVHQLENQVAAKEAEIENLKNRPISPLSQNNWINQAKPSIRKRLRNKIITWKSIRKIEKSGLFDTGYYLHHNPDVKASGINPARHYLLYGGFEGRKPSEKFDSAFYLEQNSDVKASGINPLLHYTKFGKNEGRQTAKPSITTGYTNPAAEVEFEEHTLDLPAKLMVKYPQKMKSFLLDNNGTKEFINEYFDRIYVINLRRRQKKHDEMVQKLKRLNITAEIIEAVDGYQAPHIDEYEHYKNTPLEPEHSNNKKMIYSPGVWGHLKSNRLILKDAMAKGYKKILILEDDALFIKNFHQEFEKFTNAIQGKNWMFLYLGATQACWDIPDCIFYTDKTTNSFDASLTFYHPVITAGSFALAIHHSQFESMAEKINEMNCPFDWIYKCYFQHLSNQSFVAFPNLIIADMAESDNRPKKDSEEAKLKAINRRKWDLEKYE